MDTDDGADMNKEETGIGASNEAPRFDPEHIQSNSMSGPVPAVDLEQPAPSVQSMSQFENLPRYCTLTERAEVSSERTSLGRATIPSARSGASHLGPSMQTPALFQPASLPESQTASGELPSFRPGHSAMTSLVSQAHAKAGSLPPPGLATFIRATQLHQQTETALSNAPGQSATWFSAALDILPAEITGNAPAIPGPCLPRVLPMLSTDQACFEVASSIAPAVASTGVSTSLVRADFEGQENGSQDVDCAYSSGPLNGPARSSETMTKLTGVRKNKTGRFSARIKLGGANRYIGTYSTAEEAGLAFDAVAIEHGRPVETLNFPAAHGGPSVGQAYRKRKLHRLYEDPDNHINVLLQKLGDVDRSNPGSIRLTMSTLGVPESRFLESSNYSGVRQQATQWEARIRFKDKLYSMGFFSSVEAAALAWDITAASLRRCGRLNFPEVSFADLEQHLDALKCIIAQTQAQPAAPVPSVPTRLLGERTLKRPASSASPGMMTEMPEGPMFDVVESQKALCLRPPVGSSSTASHELPAGLPVITIPASSAATSMERGSATGLPVIGVPSVGLPPSVDQCPVGVDARGLDSCRNESTSSVHGHVPVSLAVSAVQQPTAVPGWSCLFSRASGTSHSDAPRLVTFSQGEGGASPLPSMNAIETRMRQDTLETSVHGMNVQDSKV